MKLNITIFGVPIITSSLCVCENVGYYDWWLILRITIYLLHRSRDQHPHLLQRRAPGWTCRHRVPRGEPLCTPGSPPRCWWRWPSRMSPTRSCPGAVRLGSRTCTAIIWTARRSVPSVASWRAGRDRLRACFSCVGWVNSWGRARFLSFYPCSAFCRPCSKSLCFCRGSVDRCAMRKYVIISATF